MSVPSSSRPQLLLLLRTTSSRCLDCNSILWTILAPIVLHCQCIQAKRLNKTYSIVKFLLKNSQWIHILCKKKKKIKSLTWHTKPSRCDAYRLCQLVPIPSFPSHPRIRSKQNTCYNLNIPIFGTQPSLSSVTVGTITLYWGYFLTCLLQNFHPPTSSITSDQTWLCRVLGPFGIIWQRYQKILPFSGFSRLGLGSSGNHFSCHLIKSSQVV